jgi:hypothetical protein
MNTNNKLSVYQHWDPLKICVVGRSYPPEFYSWITVPHVRALFEKIAIETEEDYQLLIKKLKEFDVEVLRPTMVSSFDDILINGKYLAPPMCPRDSMIMIGEIFYQGYHLNFSKFYNSVKDSSWPDCLSIEEFDNLPLHIKSECEEIHGLATLNNFYSSYDHIFDRIQQTNTIKLAHDISDAPGAYITRVGKDLYFGTNSYDQDQTMYKQQIDKEFTQTRNHVVNTGGHSDGTYCPVCPGLIISLQDVPTYKDTFPDWEVVYLPNQSWNKIKPFLDLKVKNNGKWWIPGFENDQDVIDIVETWLGHWTGYVEETVFDVNMLIIDTKNVIVFNYNKQVFDALNRYGITPHIVPFRHRYFWDGGIHCITSDLHREGIMQDYFLNRN